MVSPVAIESFLCQPLRSVAVIAGNVLYPNTETLPMTKLPGLKSPSKKSHRKVFRPTLWLSRTPEVKAPSEQQPSPSKVKEGVAGRTFWLPQDIFKDHRPKESEEEESPSVGATFDQPNGADTSDVDYPEPDEVEEALDEEAIETQLVSCC